ncbi:MAG: hypothetical protein COA94_06605 [Rickettsiales bacterium]|nr:MAG: hypothetical protein COA94_06605 [Rickettsiales bacterium]
MKNYTIIIALALILSSCNATKSPAPIEYNHPGSTLGGRPEASDDEIISRELASMMQPETITPYEGGARTGLQQSSIVDEAIIIYHEVQVGEELKDIAQKYKQSASDIARLNNLYPPYDLEEFQIVKVKATREFTQNTSQYSGNQDLAEMKGDSLAAESKAASGPAKSASDLADGQKSVATKPADKLDFIAPVKGRVLTKFGKKTKYGINKGLNIAAKQGTKVLAATSGRVIYSDYDATFGYLVIIKVHNKNIVTSYAHLEDLILSKGESVQQGNVVGYVGQTGKVAKSQLHFAIREGKIAKDPLEFVSYSEK